LADNEGLAGVSVKAILDEGDINVDDVAVFLEFCRHWESRDKQHG
jgi:hypothetical protein